jgi:S-formylglutathione hydrolase FrmB
MHVSFYSDVLKIDCGIEVVYPQNCTRTPPSLRNVIEPPYQVLYLLHGITRDQTAWVRLSSIEQDVMDMGLVVIMPTTQRGQYINQANGYRYSDYLTEELPQILSKMFHISTKREDTFIAGFSMGGYGAFKAALTYPERYACAASLSGALDIGIMYDLSAGVVTKEEVLINFNNKDPRGGEYDLFELAKNGAKSGKTMPKLYVSCGTEDRLHSTNVEFFQAAKDILDVTFYDEPGDHVWNYWDRNIKKVLEWLPIRQRDPNYIQRPNL